MAGQMRGASATGLEEVQGAVDDARAYAREQGFKAPAFKDVLEWKLDGARCYSVDDGVYFIEYDGKEYRCANGTAAEASAAEAPVSYATLVEAEAVQDKPVACITRGLNAEGDKGHGYYVRDAQGAWQLASAEGAASVYQLGYSDGGSVNDAIDAFHASSFHTLVFPQGDYLVAHSIWAKHDNRAYYGLGAKLYTDAAFVDVADSSYKSMTGETMLSVRGNAVWGELQDDGVRRNAYYTTSHQEYNGLTFEKPAAYETGGYKWLAVVRNASDITFRHCAFRAVEYDTRCIDLYGNYDGVTIENVTCDAYADVQIRDLCDNVGSLIDSGTVQKGTNGGGRNVVVRNCHFKVGKTIEEGLPLFAALDAGLSATEKKNCLVENVLLENNEWVMEKPSAELVAERGKTRLIAFTCGYQDSPVRNITVRGNTFDVFANMCFMQVGYVDGVEFCGNDVHLWGEAVDAKGNTNMACLLRRSSDPRTGPTTNVNIHDNTFALEAERGDESGAARVLTKLIDPALGVGSVTFARNEVSVAGKVTQLLDSTAEVADNAFKLHDVKNLYSDVRDVHGNVYEIGELTNLYTADGANVAADVSISGERATIASMPANAHLMSFNNAPAYNGHAIRFTRCDFAIASTPNKYRRIAYDTSGVKDGTTLYLTSCSIGGFDEAPFNTIGSIEPVKVTLVIERSISYDLGGGSLPAGEANPATYTGSEAFRLVNPVRKGYSFAGWTGTGLVSPTMEVTVPEGSSEDRSYKATWAELPDYLGSIVVKMAVSKGKATIIGLLSKVAGSVVVNTVIDNPAAVSRPVAAIGRSAFAKSGITAIVLGDGVQAVGASAFAGSPGLKSAEFGKNVKTVGAGAFSGSKKLKTLKVRSAKLTKKSCKKMLKGSKVRVVKLVGMKKAQKAKALKKYRKWFPKKVAGKRLIVK